VFSFIRRGVSTSTNGSPSTLVCVSNFAAVPHSDFRLGLPEAGTWRELVNTDAATYTGSGVGNLGSVTAVDGAEGGQPAHATLVLPPLATIWLRRD
jgi:1,4-alpha-glucan branching enzyme